MLSSNVQNSRLVRIALLLLIFIFTSHGRCYASATVDQAVFWASSQLGRQDWNWFCFVFCRNAYNENSVPGIGSAIDAWNNNGETFGDRQSGNAPRGALVFFDATSANGNYGHVGIANGDGTMYHAWTNGVRKDSVSYGGIYLGWRWPNAWTSDTVTSSSKPDLIVREVIPSKKLLTTGESFQIETRIKNVGKADVTSSFKIKYLLSGGTKIDSNPTTLADDNINSLDADDSKWEDATVTAPSNPGTYNITVRADSSKDIDEDHESNNYFDPPVVITVVPPNNLPAGWLDSAACDSISGWARDPDTTSAIDVHVYANGPSGQGSYAIGAAANNLRPDLPFTDKYHGYSIPTPASLKDGQPHSIYVYAIDSSGGTNPLLPGSPKIITCAPPDAITPSVAITSPTAETTYTTSTNSLSIGGIASDNVGVTLVTWANNRGGSGVCSGTTSWSASGIPLLSGDNIITVTAKDASGNIKRVTLTVSLAVFALNVNIYGNGGGSVSGDVNCTLGEFCAPKEFVPGTNATLLATPNAVSIFAGWSGSCTSTTRSCSLVMDTAKSVTATFTVAPKVTIGARGFSTLQAAYNDVGTQDNAVIKLLGGTLLGNFVANRAVTVTIEGGYDASYAAATTETVIDGDIRITAGAVKMKSISIKPPSLRIPGDLNVDGKVDIFDYNILQANLGKSECGNIADINRDCRVDALDLEILQSNFQR